MNQQHSFASTTLFVLNFTVLNFTIFMRQDFVRLYFCDFDEKKALNFAKALSTSFYVFRQNLSYNLSKQTGTS